MLIIHCKFEYTYMYKCLYRLNILNSYMFAHNSSSKLITDRQYDFEDTNFYTWKIKLIIMYTHFKQY